MSVFFQHPRGLYQSWNFGISKLTTEYTHISTVGDTISREGLERLRQIANQYQCDVVASKPRFVDTHGRDEGHTNWPIDDIRRLFPGQEPLVLEGIELALLAMENCTSAILGSSASNIYRTRCLQQRPFPTEYGTVGDGAWGLINACEVRMGFTGEVFSTFQSHPKSYPASDYFIESLNMKLFKLACESLHNFVARSPETQKLAKLARAELIIQSLNEHLACQRRLEKYRDMKFPWILNPAAWAARIGRDPPRAKTWRVESCRLEGNASARSKSELHGLQLMQARDALV